MKDKDRSIISRQRYFDIAIHHPLVKECISGKNEPRVISLLESLDYKLNRDFVRQHPIGEKFVIDFAFINLRIAIEADGDDHKQKQQVKIDKARDKFLIENGWIPLRIPDKELFGFKGSFYKNLIREVVEERKIQRENGLLYEIDISKFSPEDYDL